MMVKSFQGGKGRKEGSTNHFWRGLLYVAGSYIRGKEGQEVRKAAMVLKFREESEKGGGRPS